MADAARAGRDLVDGAEEVLEQQAVQQAALAEGVHCEGLLEFHVIPQGKYVCLVSVHDIDA